MRKDLESRLEAAFADMKSMREVDQGEKAGLKEFAAAIQRRVEDLGHELTSFKEESCELKGRDCIEKYEEIMQEVMDLRGNID